MSLDDLDDCQPGWDMSCGRCKACKRRDAQARERRMQERGRAHPECTWCEGSGLRDDTLGNSKTCFCMWDEEYKARLDAVAAARIEAETKQLTDWDL